MEPLAELFFFLWDCLWSLNFKKTLFFLLFHRIHLKFENESAASFNNAALKHDIATLLFFQLLHFFQ